MAVMTNATKTFSLIDPFRPSKIRIDHNLYDSLYDHGLKLASQKTRARKNPSSIRNKLFILDWVLDHFFPVIAPRHVAARSAFSAVSILHIVDG